MPTSTHLDTKIWGSKHLTDCDPDGPKSSDDGYLHNRGVYQNEGIVIGDSISHGSRTVPQISTTASKTAGGNVHSGAPPPWLEATDNSQSDVQQKPVLGEGSILSPLKKPVKSNKLNPKRVGAAWAEKRKIELEMEKRGEIVTSDCDANWLPNFGRVWQSGSRKESRKEFEVEKQKVVKAEREPEMPIKIQPYISKRMRRDGNE